jgi:hypothetical protein
MHKFKFTLLTLTALTFFSNSKAQYYVSLMPAFYTSAGNTGERLTMDIEVGKQWDVLSLGLDLGKTNFTKQIGKDTTNYAELRSNLNVFQQGKFTNTITIGCGYVFNASQNIMIETTTGIEYSFSHEYHMNLFFGTYYFSGKNSASNNSFFGMSLVRFFLNKKPKKNITSEK